MSDTCSCGCPKKEHGEYGCLCGCAWIACEGDDPKFAPTCKHNEWVLTDYGGEFAPVLHSAKREIYAEVDVDGDLRIEFQGDDHGMSSVYLPANKVYELLNMVKRKRPL